MGKNTKNYDCWKFVNLPLPSALIIILFLLLLYMGFVKSERVDCVFSVKLNQEMLNKSWTIENVRLIEKFLTEEYTYNVTFENYQEALAFEQLAFDELGRSQIPETWEYHFWCGLNKTLESSNIADSIEHIVK